MVGSKMQISSWNCEGSQQKLDTISKKYNTYNKIEKVVLLDFNLWK